MRKKQNQNQVNRGIFFNLFSPYSILGIIFLITGCFMVAIYPSLVCRTGDTIYEFKIPNEKLGQRSLLGPMELRKKGALYGAFFVGSFKKEATGKWFIELKEEGASYPLWSSEESFSIPKEEERYGFLVKSFKLSQDEKDCYLTFELKESNSPARLSDLEIVVREDIKGHWEGFLVFVGGAAGFLGLALTLILLGRKDEQLD